MITPEQALAIYHAGPEAVVKVICELSRQDDLLQKRVEELERKVARLAKNSTNSSKPPSSDITRPAPQQRQQGERKIGAQPGHPRHERPAFPEAEIKTFHEYRLDACPECGNAEITFLNGPPRVLQQMEIEKVIVRKEEHRSYPVWCERCGKTHYHPFPEDVVREGLFKERLTALVAYMKAVDHASFSTIRKFVRDVMGENVSRGYLRKVVEKASHALDAPYAELLGRLPLEQALNVDETGHKDNGGKFWTWVFRAELYVLFKIDKTRGSKVLLDVLGEEFDGVLGCDYFSAYHKYMTDFNITVQFCIAHLIRDIKFLTGLPDAETRAYGTRLKREAFNMAKRFRENGKAYFEFITTPGIGPTNNLAEQAVRFVVIDRRITQGTRGEKGRETCERLWTVVGTCAMQGRSAFEFILAAVRAYFRGEPAPSLLPALG